MLIFCWFWFWCQYFRSKRVGAGNGFTSKRTKARESIKSFLRREWWKSAALGLRQDSGVILNKQKHSGNGKTTLHRKHCKRHNAMDPMANCCFLNPQTRKQQNVTSESIITWWRCMKSMATKQGTLAYSISMALARDDICWNSWYHWP